ncbi:MAG TPA: hypothetical protein VKA48_07815, partial [Gammaproteobacteria bacterium]|nr:hypothetical protein [Gammaproteobacteria bacterium]
MSVRGMLLGLALLPLLLLQGCLSLPTSEEKAPSLYLLNALPAGQGKADQAKEPAVSVVVESPVVGPGLDTD